MYVPLPRTALHVRVVQRQQVFTLGFLCSEYCNVHTTHSSSFSHPKPISDLTAGGEVGGKGGRAVLTWSGLKSS